MSHSEVTGQILVIRMLKYKRFSTPIEFLSKSLSSITRANLIIFSDFSIDVIIYSQDLAINERFVTYRDKILFRTDPRFHLKLLVKRDPKILEVIFGVKLPNQGPIP